MEFSYEGSTSSVVVRFAVRVTSRDFRYLQQFDGITLSDMVSELIRYARLFAPNGPDGAKPRDARGRFLPLKRTE